MRSGPRATRRPATVIATILAAVLLVSACSGGDEPDVGPSAGIVRRTPTTVDAEAPTAAPEGNIVNRQALEVAACFNDYVIVDAESGDDREITTQLDCRRPHLGEIYASHTHPGTAQDPFPGNAEMQRWATVRCYGDFEAFVGERYELSELEIGVIPPTEESWLAGPHREVLCFVRAPDDGLLSGSMAGSGI